MRNANQKYKDVEQTRQTHVKNLLLSLLEWWCMWNLYKWQKHIPRYFGGAVEICGQWMIHLGFMCIYQFLLFLKCLFIFQNIDAYLWISTLFISLKFIVTIKLFSWEKLLSSSKNQHYYDSYISAKLIIKIRKKCQQIFYDNAICAYEKKDFQATDLPVRMIPWNSK